MSDLRRRRHLRHRVEDRLAELDVPDPFDVAVLCERLAAKRGQPIRLRPQPMGLGPCGLWVEVAGADYIVFERDTTPLHQEQIVLHEVGHLLANHTPASISDQESLAMLLPDLDPDMVRRVMGRTGYTSQEEEEAELLASLVLQRTGRADGNHSRPASPQASHAIGVLGTVLGDRPR